ncbi:hypothetical protein VFPBJ_08129 [Purpureocillium lilacinum]|uniref:Uncharacterized protein n=1 Tax=Purpureocillium lilacinum TaxID=33203 RepID=A0A179GIG2_PURLI|nr:hypothetical protein VFPBJ_08129 [Purpureocillium lilacinum]
MALKYPWENATNLSFCCHDKCFEGTGARFLSVYTRRGFIPLILFAMRTTSQPSSHDQVLSVARSGSTTPGPDTCGWISGNRGCRAAYRASSATPTYPLRVPMLTRGARQITHLHAIRAKYAA